MVKDLRIEPCKEEHLTELVGLIKKFDKEAISEYGMEMSESAVTDMFFNCKQHGLSLVIDGIARGVIAGLITTPFHSKEKVWQEIIWYVEEPYRKYGVKLYKAMEKKLADEGISKMVMVLMHNSKKEKLEDFYKSLGYRPMEYQFIKEIK